MSRVRLGDLRFTLRSLWRAPTATLLSITMLALGIGGATALFTIVDDVLLDPLPFDEPDRLVGVWLTSPGDGIEFLTNSRATFLSIQRTSTDLESVGLWYPRAYASSSGTGSSERVVAAAVTHEMFDVLRLPPELGRSLEAVDDRPESEPVVVLGHGYWMRRFGGDPTVVGSTIALDGTPHEIVGVMPETFQLGDASYDVFTAARLNPSDIQLGDFSYMVIGRLRRGTTIQEATASLGGLVERSAEEFPGGMTVAQVQADGLSVRMRPLQDEIVGEAGAMLYVLLGAIVVLLLVACLNTANLLMLRTRRRYTETAVRAALGASRARLLALPWLEATALALAGGVVGLSIVWLAFPVLHGSAPSTLPRRAEIDLDGTVVLFGMFLTLVTSILVAAGPVLQLARRGTGTFAGSSTRGVGGASGDGLARRLLAAGQVAAAVALLIASGLMMRSIAHLDAVHPGFTDGEHALTFRVAIPGGLFDEPTDLLQFYEDGVRALEALPAVISASGSNGMPMDGLRSNQSIHIEDFPVAEGDTPPQARINWVAGDLFATLQTPLLMGRELTWTDARDRARVVVVNATYARRHWGSEEAAMGRRVQYCCGDWHEIVGVVTDARDDGLAHDPAPTIYWPLAVDGFWGGQPWVPTWFAFVVRTGDVDPMALVEPARAALGEKAPKNAARGRRSASETVATSRHATASGVFRRQGPRSCRDGVQLAPAIQLQQVVGGGNERPFTGCLRDAAQ